MEKPQNYYDFDTESKPAAKTIDLSSEQDELHKPLSLKVSIKYFFIRNTIMGIGKLAAVLPERLTYKACAGLAMIVYRRLPKFRKLAREHLEIAFGAEMSPEEIDDILLRTYVNYGKNFAEFLMVPHKSKEWVEMFNIKRVKNSSANNFIHK